MSRIAQWVWNAKLMPFADAASADLPLPRLLRLALFQVSVGMALALLNGTLDEVEPIVGDVVVGRGAIVDAVEWKHDLPKAVK